MQCLLNRHCSHKSNEQGIKKPGRKCSPWGEHKLGDQGFVLIVTLGIMAVLSVLASSFVFNTRVEIKTSSWRKHALGAYYTARAGLQRTAGIIAAHGEEQANGPASPWWSDKSLYHNIQTGSGTYTIRPFSHNTVADTAKTPRAYGVTDEESCLNINVATAEMLMQFDGITSVLAEEILIYRARQSNRGNALKQDQVTISGPITNIMELLHIHGITRDILFGGPDKASRLGNNITCYSSGKVNVNTARPMVLTSLGFSEGEVRAVELFRRRKENAQSVDDFLTQMNVNKERLQKSIPLLTVKSTHFRMAGTAAILNKASALTILARCDLTDENTFFSLWQVTHDGVFQ